MRKGIGWVIKMRRLAIITARGGSKRIPKKNIRDFCGRPIIAYSIDAAKKSNVFDEVMVSTDSEEIKSISLEYGAGVPFIRSAKSSDDFATTSDVLMEVLAEYKKIGKSFDQVCCLYPTAPFVTSEKIIDAFRILEGSDVDTVIPVVEFSYPPQRGFVVEENRLFFKDESYIDARSQDLEKIYHDCGQFYAFKVESFLRNRNFLIGNIAPLITNELEMQDIDNLSDWKLAEIKYKLMIGEFDEL